MAAVASSVDRAGQAEAPVYAFRKNAREEVRASLSTYHGYRLADLRVFVEDEAGNWIPTRKGLAVRVEDLPALRDAIDALRAAA
jgi:hypothetical protein